MRPQRTHAALLGAAPVLAGLIAGCELPAIIVPPGSTITIVQGVLRPDRTQQWLLIEESFNGTLKLGTGGDGAIPSPGATATPVSNARVIVSNRADRTMPCRIATLLEDLAPDEPRPGAYWAPVGCPTMAPGDTLDLMVETDAGIVTGRTVLPLVTRIALGGNGATFDLPAAPLVFNRDTDTLTAAVEAQSGRAIHVTVQPEQPDGTEPRIVGDRTTFFWADSTAITLPGDFVNIFESDFDPDEDTPDLFVAGMTYRIVVAFTDRNFYDALRSGNSPLSGRGFINSLEGGFGYFGSLVAESNRLQSVGTLDDLREGAYRITGTIGSARVALEMELYLGRPLTPDGPALRFAAFTTGQWVFGPIDQSVSGLLNRDHIVFDIVQASGGFESSREPTILRWFVAGDVSETGQGTLVVNDQDGDPIGSVVLERIP